MGELREEGFGEFEAGVIEVFQDIDVIAGKQVITADFVVVENLHETVALFAPG